MSDLIIIAPWPRVQRCPDTEELMLWRDRDGLHLTRWFTDGTRFDQRLGQSSTVKEFLERNSLEAWEGE